MKKNIRWKVITIIAVIVLMAVLSYPPKDKIQLGLDLKGGMHLVMRVITDDAIDNETDNEILRLQQQLRRKNITEYGTIAKVDGRNGQFNITGFASDLGREIRDLLNDQFKEWDINYSGTTIRVSMKPNVESYLRDQAVRQAIETLGNRVNELGLSDIPIQRQGFGGERIIIELPGVENPQRVRNILEKTAMLEWKLIHAGPANDEATLLDQYGGEIPDDLEILRALPERTEGRFYVASKVAVVTGVDLRDARRSEDEWGAPSVSFTLNPEAGKRFERFTGDHINEPLSIVLDDVIQEVANIKDRIPASSGGIIHGSFTVESAEDLALVLRAGALPADIEYLEERTIGPSLGADSIRKGLTAIIASLILVLIFMGVYYRLSGINAIAALLLNILIIMGILSYFKAHLTVPGIAGIILTVGMAVDANVLVFERIREELRTGKSVLSSIVSGFSRAFRTILDANMTTIIAAVFLFQFGTGPIRGFAVTLIIGITASMFTALFVSRTIYDLFFVKRKKREKLSI
jgi:preprotein translocase subunit SecD